MRLFSWFWLGLCLLISIACAGSSKAILTPSASDPVILMAGANRVVFLIPFSHWDTDWHATYKDYSSYADRNILAAIKLAKENRRFRYTLEQVLFVQHFWQTHPEARADLTKFVHNRQISFAWAGITQPETSLVAPAIQERNLQLGQEWIAATFGPEYVPHSAWQSDAFGTSAAFPHFLQQRGIPYLFLGRWQRRCFANPDNCPAVPHAFFWQSPASDDRVLVTTFPYADVWGALYRLKTEEERLAGLRKVIDEQIARTDSKFLFLPVGFDFVEPFDYLVRLTDRWNREYPDVALLLSDPQTAFEQIATQNLPLITRDFNPMWQAFYGTRPQAKIADKESEYLLTAGDNFGALINALPSSAWHTATVSAHYDNISAVSYDKVWAATQRPRYEQTVATAASDLAVILGQISRDVTAPLLVFNPSAWPRSEVIELQGDLPDLSALASPIQQLGANRVAIYVESVPAISYTTVFSNAGGITHPVVVAEAEGRITLHNGLVSVTVDPAFGGTFVSLKRLAGPDLLAEFGDDVVYIRDDGDVYGSRFGEEQARQSQVVAQASIEATGPLLARLQLRFALGGQPITKTITLRANSPVVEVALEIKALPQTTAIVQMPTALDSDVRTDDLGFLSFTHAVDNRPIQPGDITYRREIFYPVMYWSDVTANGNGLILLTHGLQGLGGTRTLNLMLVRWAEDKQEANSSGEGVIDADYHTLRYAYLPHGGALDQSQATQAAYNFNQPLLPVWRVGEVQKVQFPFEIE